MNSYYVMITEVFYEAIWLSNEMWRTHFGERPHKKSKPAIRKSGLTEVKQRKQSQGEGKTFAMPAKEF